MTGIRRMGSREFHFEANLLKPATGYHILGPHFIGDVVSPDKFDQVGNHLNACHVMPRFPPLS
jgi:hypothetical protein